MRSYARFSLLTDPLGYMLASGDNWPFYLGGLIPEILKKMTQWKKCQFGGVACAKGASVTNAPKNPLGRPKPRFLAPLGQISPLNQ